MSLNKKWLLKLTPLLLIISGLFLMAKPGYHFLRQIWLRHQAAGIWAERSQETELRPGKPAGWLKAEKAGLDILLTYDATPENLMDFPCISTRGVDPGERGTLIIQGHRDRHFRNLGALELGDLVSLENVEGLPMLYRVQETEVMGVQDLEDRLPDGNNYDGMAMVTCYPFQYVGPAPERYVVWLKRVEMMGNKE